MESVYNGIMQPSYITKVKQEDISKHQKTRKLNIQKNKIKKINLKLSRVRVWINNQRCLYKQFVLI